MQTGKQVLSIRSRKTRGVVAGIFLMAIACAGLVGRGAVPEGLRIEQGGLGAVVESLAAAGMSS